MFQFLSTFLNRYKDVYISAQMRVEAELRARLSDKDALLLEQKQHIDQLSMKIERYELVLLPISSRAGAALVARPLQTETSDQKRGARSMVPMQGSSWQSYLSTYLAEQAELDRIEKAKSSQEQSNGTYSTGRQGVHESASDGSAQSKA
jgi:hypothetical protein